MSFAVILHIGAGFYSEKNEKMYFDLCRFALTATCNYFRKSETSSAIKACNIALKILEDSESTNAGYGSNLTVNGNVECEACMMDGESLKYAAAGMLRRIRNPVTLAYHMLINQIECPVSSSGRVFPHVLCGDGAEAWAKSNIEDFDLVSNGSMKSKKSLNAWKRYLKMTDKDETVQAAKKRRFDTIGVVCVDPQGRVAAASSSGGIALKQEGRLGQSCTYGCGCWAEDSIGLVSTGTGEQLIKTQLPQRIGDDLNKSDDVLYNAVKTSFQRNFMDSKYLRDEINDKVGGIVGLKSMPEYAMVEGFVVHSSEALCYGTATSVDSINKISCHISRKSKGCDFSIRTFTFC